MLMLYVFVFNFMRMDVLLMLADACQCLFQCCFTFTATDYRCLEMGSSGCPPLLAHTSELSVVAFFIFTCLPHVKTFSL